MSDSTERLEAVLRVALRAPVPIDPAAKRRIMDLVRASATPSAVAAPPVDPRAVLPARRVRRLASVRDGWAGPVRRMALAAGVGGVMALGALHPSTGTGSGAGERPGRAGLTDTVVATIRDTVHLVRFVLVAPGAARVALAGDFNRWDPHATPLTRSAHAWVATVALAPGRHRYAFVVDDTQWVADPATPRAAGDRGHPTSVVSVVDSTN